MIIRTNTRDSTASEKAISSQCLQELLIGFSTTTTSQSSHLQLLTPTTMPAREPPGIELNHPKNEGHTKSQILPSLETLKYDTREHAKTNLTAHNIVGNDTSRSCFNLLSLAARCQQHAHSNNTDLIDSNDPRAAYSMYPLASKTYPRILLLIAI